MKLWKIQKFFGDVVYDLRNRGLLPVVILLLVAIVAVPIVISRGGSSGSSPSQASSAVAKPAPEAQSAVVSYAPGVRDYTKRLDGLSAKDPFRQKFAESAAAASDLNSTVPAPSSTDTSSSAVATSPSTGSAPSSGGSGGSSGSGGSGTGGPTVRYFYSVADVSVGEVTQPLQRHKKLKPFTPLPNQTVPVLIYLGASLDGKHAYFSISKSADQPNGAGVCVPSPTDCSLLVLAAGQAEDIVYSVDGKTYRVKVNKINRVVTRSKPIGSSAHGSRFHFTK
jgi:hypothetical protein